MNPHDRFSEHQYAQWLLALQRLHQMEPLQYITGTAWFDGMDLSVGPGVLIPRPETEELIEWITETPLPHPLHILDLCTGSGCIPLSLARRYPQAQGLGIDIRPEALSYARANATRFQPRVQFQQADALQLPLPAPDTIPWSLITCNPPYIPQSERGQMHPNVLDYEPGLALFVPDQHPLLYYKAVAHYAAHTLHPQGYLFFEIHETHGQELLAWLQAHHWINPTIRQDLQGKDRILRSQPPIKL